MGTRRKVYAYTKVYGYKKVYGSTRRYTGRRTQTCIDLYIIYIDDSVLSIAPIAPMSSHMYQMMEFVTAE